MGTHVIKLSWRLLATSTTSAHPYMVLTREYAKHNERIERDDKFTHSLTHSLARLLTLLTRSLSLTRSFYHSAVNFVT